MIAKRRAWSPYVTGDSLFVSSAGRPDLLGSDAAETLTKQLFETLRGFYLELPDSVAIFPAHGHGSPCGADIGDRMQSTIGYERQFNPFLQFEDFDRFRDHALRTAPPVPTYYPLMKRINAEGPEILGGCPRMPALPPKAFQRAVEHQEGMLVDTRSMLAFGGGHIRGALNIGGTPMLSIWAGWLLDPEQPVLLVLEDDRKLEEIVSYFVRTGFTKFAGYLVGGMRAWDNAGLPLDEVGQMPVHEVHEAGPALQIVDVRTPAEWAQGHLPGARHIFLPELRERASELDPERATAVYCDSGYRASIGASMLKRANLPAVLNIPGSWQAWRHAGFPVEGGGAE